MMSGVDFAVLCVSDSLQKSKTPVVEGRNFNFGLPVASRRLSQFEFPLATAQFLHQCLLTDISNAISRIQSCKYENSGCLGKNTFCLRFMDAELRCNALYDAIVSKSSSNDQAVEKYAILFFL